MSTFCLLAFQFRNIRPDAQIECANFGALKRHNSFFFLQKMNQNFDFWQQSKETKNCSGLSVNTNLFYTRYIVYNSIVGWPTINKKKKLMSCCILELSLWNTSVFINLKLFIFILCFHSITLKNPCFLRFVFVSLFKSYACALCIEFFMSHSHFFNWNFLNMFYTWHDYFLKICLMMCEDFFICFFKLYLMMWWVLFWLQTWHCLPPLSSPPPFPNLLVNVDNLILCKKVWHGLLMRINWTSSRASLSFAKEDLTNIATTSKVIWNSHTNYLSKWPKGGRPQKLIAYSQSLTIANTCNHLEWWDLKKWKTLEKSWNEMKKRRQRVNGMHWHKMHVSQSLLPYTKMKKPLLLKVMEHKLS